MNKKQYGQILVMYEDIILDHTHQMGWIYKQKHKSIAYRMAIWSSIHNKTIEKLEIAHQTLAKVTGHNYP
jgi:hypothetical protein